MTLLDAKSREKVNNNLTEVGNLYESECWKGLSDFFCKRFCEDG